MKRKRILIICNVIFALLLFNCSKKVIIKKNESKIIRENKIPEMNIPEGIQYPIKNITVSTIKSWDLIEDKKSGLSIVSFNTKFGKKKYLIYKASLQMRMNSLEELYCIAEKAIFVIDKKGNWKRELVFANSVTNTTYFDIDENDEIFLFERCWDKKPSYEVCYRYSKNFKFIKKYNLGKTRSCDIWFADGGIIWGYDYPMSQIKKFIEYSPDMLYNPLSKKMLRHKIFMAPQLKPLDEGGLVIYGKHEMKDKIKKQELALVPESTNYKKNKKSKWNYILVGDPVRFLGIDNNFNYYFSFPTYFDVYDIYVIKISMYGKLISLKKIFHVDQYANFSVASGLHERLIVTDNGICYAVIPYKSKLMLLEIK